MSITSTLNRWQASFTPLRFLAVVALVVVIGAAIVFVGISKRSDGGWMTAACGQLRWGRDQIPVRVYVDAVDEDWSDEVRSAMRLVDPSGRLLVWSGYLPPLGTPPPASILVHAISVSDHGRTNFHWIGTQSGCRIGTVDVALPGQVPEGAVRSRATAHELGHALGLAHADDETSIMYPRATGRFAYVLSTADRERLEDAYLR